MRNILAYFIFSLIIIAGSSFIFSPQEDIDKMWLQVKKLEQDGLPKSAIEVVDKIYKQARSEDNDPEVIKALIYRVSLQSQFEEDHIVKAIAFFEEELTVSHPPNAQIIHSLLAELYTWYYQNNRWKINERGTVIGYDNEDIKTWDAVKLNKIIRENYMQSLNNREMLEDTRLSSFKTILTNTEKENFIFWPTLYDLLANRALAYLTGYDVGFAELADDVSIQNLDYLSPAGRFVELNIQDAEARKDVLILFKHLMSLHLKNKDTEAFVDLDLRRLKYVYENSNLTEDEDEAYIKALQVLADEYQNENVYARIATVLAQRYVVAGNKYKPKQSEAYRYELNKAVEICESVIAKMPDGQESAECRQMLRTLEETSYNFQTESAVIPGKPILGMVSFKNAGRLFFKVVSVDKKSILKNAHGFNSETIKGHLGNSAIKRWHFDLPDTKDHQQHSAEFSFPELELGYYIIFASEDSNFKNQQNVVYNLIRVTNLAYITNNDHSKGKLEIFVLDRETGHPVSNAKVTTYQYVYNPDKRVQELKKMAEAVSDQQGMVVTTPLSTDKTKQITFSIQKGEDYIDSRGSEYLRKTNKSVELKTKTYLFTDRAIYRPGQIVYFKGIVVDKNSMEVKVKTAYRATVSLLDVNRKSIGSVEVTTNEYGSYEGSFIIPVGGLNGRMTLKTKTGSATIQVEEYKRPSFEVSFDTITEKYKLGDRVSLGGNAETFAGTPLLDATVKYRVVQTPLIIPYYRSYFPVPSTGGITIAQGITTTDQDGNFKIDFPTTDVAQRNMRYFSGNHYTVYADVLDITGEVQSGSTTVIIGKQAVLLELSLNEVLSNEDLNKAKLSAKNYNGGDVEVDVDLKVYKLTPPDRLLHKRYWSQPDMQLIPQDDFVASFPHLAYGDEEDPNNWKKNEVFSTAISFEGEIEILADFFREKQTGEFLVEAISVSASGDSAIERKIVNIYSNSSKSLPGNMIDWSVVNKTTAEPGDIIKLTVGSAAKKSKIYYEILNGDQLVAAAWVEVSKSQKLIEIPIAESYRGGIEIRTAMMHFNRVYLHTHSIDIPFSNKKLKLTLETLRDHITPGAAEEWKVKISGPDGEKIAAELLAAMYDASLDQFKSNSWNLNLYQSKRTVKYIQSGFFEAAHSRYLDRNNRDYESFARISYPEINWFKYQQYGPSYRGHDMILKSSMYNADGAAVPNERENGEVVVEQDQEIQEEVNLAETEKSSAENVHIRTNFNETAFFYPQLKTDSSGSVIFSFKAPDALTEWKIMLLAQTLDLKTGSLVESIKAKKELMIIPNLPRFVRQGDKLLFSAKLINFSGQDLEVKSSVEFFNALSGKAVQVFVPDEEIIKTSTMSAGENTLLQWEIEIPFDLSLLAYRITATSPSHTDGEERLIPVLTNRMLITETMPFYINGKQSKDYSFDKLIKQTADESSSAVNHKLTLEFASNPAWYAVQSLPYLSNSGSENSSAIFYRLYANLLSQYIIDQHPTIKNVFNSWQQATPEALYSNLMKNEELKNVVLNATPWVLEAEDETEQKRRIALLFDMNRMAGDRIFAIEKLRKRQLSNGGWSWFEGMKDDRHITQQIVIGFSRMIDKQVIILKEHTDINSMLVRALKYLDNRMAEDYEKHKSKNNSNLQEDHLKSGYIEYLYARTLLLEEFPIAQNDNEWFNYYVGQAKKYWLRKNNYLQAMIALSLNKLGSRNEAEGILRSLKERSLHSDELGMYWRQERGWYWYQAPIETQAITIEAFNTISNDSKSVEQMKIWLLKQKQTNRWPTSSATAEAVFAILFSGEDLLADDKLVNIKIGDQQIIPTKIEGMKIESGTGYFKTSWSGSEIIPEMGKIQLENPNNHIAWGAAYWQYFEDLDKITSADSPLNITKKIFTELMTDKGPVINPLGENESLTIGDKVIVQLVITTDRDMDYVHIKDMRATALEPMENISGYSYGGGLWFYKNITDVSTEFFIHNLQKGTYVLEYPMKVTQKGIFSNGIATIQSYYAPEFSAHSEGLKLNVK